MAKMREFTSSQREQIYKQATAFWEQSTRMMTPLFDQVNEYERAWREQLPQDLEDTYAKMPDRAALAPPDFYINIKFLRAAIRQLIFSSKPFATLSLEGQPNLRNDLIIKAEHVLQSMLDSQSNGRGFESEADKACHQAFYAGISACFTHWVHKYRRIPERHEDTQRIIGDPKTGGPVFRPQLVSSYAETKSLDIRRVRIDPSAEGRDDIRIVGYHYIAKLSDLFLHNRDPQSSYKFDEAELTRSDFPRAEYFQYLKGEHEKYTEKTDQNEDFSDKNVEIWEVRGIFRFKNANGSLSFRDLVVRIANRQTLISAKDNDLPIPGYELFDFPAIEQDVARFFTMGIVEPMMDTWIEKFIKRNQALDEASNRAYDQYIGDKNACQELPSTIERQPNQLLLVDLLSSGVDDVNKVFKPIDKPPTGHDTFIQAEALTKDIRQGAGLNVYTEGLDPSRKETATAVAELVAGGRSITEQVARNLKDTYFAPAWKKQLILWQFFNGHRDMIIYDQQGQTWQIKPGELEQFFNIEIDISTALDAPAMQRRMIEVFPVLKDDPYYEGYTLRQTLNRVLKLPNADKILRPNEHLQAIIYRENMALAAGVKQPVSPFDNHIAHQPGHEQALMSLVNPETGAVDPIVQMSFQEHMTEHQFFIDQANQALGNTKELGGNTGQLVNPEHGSIKARTKGGVGLKSEGRA